MTALERTEDLTPAQRAARKAWATRRARAAGNVTPTHCDTHKPTSVSANDPAVAAALAAFDQAADADMPDWHGAALRLKRALTAAIDRPAIAPRVTARNRPTGASGLLPAPFLADYRITRADFKRLAWPSPMLVVEFADGEVVRAPAVSVNKRPVNIGRGLRIAVAFYQHRLYRRMGVRRGHATWVQVPPIRSCVCETTGEAYNADLCTAKTLELRMGRGLVAAPLAIEA